MRTIVLGLGNPILCDDSVGIHVARRVRETFAGSGGIDQVEVHEVYAGGIRLIDVLSGFDRAILVDAMLTGQRPPGSWTSFFMDDDGPAEFMPSLRNVSSTHDINLPTALELGRMLGMPMPEEVRVWGVEAQNVESFSETPTELVARAVAPVAAEVAFYAGGPRSRVPGAPAAPQEVS